MRSALIVWLAVACSSPQSAPPPTPTPEPTEPKTGGYAEPDPAPVDDPPPQSDNLIIADFAALRDNMCNCRDKTCAEQVNKEFEEWLKRNENAKGSDGEQEQAKAIAEDYTKCMMAALTGGPSQGQKCAPNDRCASGLTCIKYYGVAGAAGPELSSCEIPCGPGKAVCPSGQSCKVIADGPGQVCRN